MEAVFLLGVSFTRTTAPAVACLTLAVGFSGFAISGELAGKCSLDNNYSLDTFSSITVIISFAVFVVDAVIVTDEIKWLKC